MPDSDRELEIRSLKARVSVLEHMMVYIMRRLGADERYIRDYQHQQEVRGDHTYLYGAVNSILNSLKPPPRRD